MQCIGHRISLPGRPRRLTERKTLPWEPNLSNIKRPVDLSTGFVSLLLVADVGRQSRVESDCVLGNFDEVKWFF